MYSGYLNLCLFPTPRPPHQIRCTHCCSSSSRCCCHRSSRSTAKSEAAAVAAAAAETGAAARSFACGRCLVQVLLQLHACIFAVCLLSVSLAYVACMRSSSNTMKSTMSAPAEYLWFCCCSRPSASCCCRPAAAAATPRAAAACTRAACGIHVFASIDVKEARECQF